MDVLVVTRSAFFGPIRFTSDHKSVARLDQLNRLNLHIVELWVGVQSPRQKRENVQGITLQLVWRRTDDGELIFPDEYRNADDLFGDEYKLRRPLPTKVEIMRYVHSLYRDLTLRTRMNGPKE